jgi:hypothetical protein
MLRAPNSYAFQSVYGVIAASSAHLDAGKIFEAFSDGGAAIGPSKEDFPDPALLVAGVVPNLYLFVGMKPWPPGLDQGVSVTERRHT